MEKLPQIISDKIDEICYYIPEIIEEEKGGYFREEPNISSIKHDPFFVIISFRYNGNNSLGEFYLKKTL